MPCITRALPSPGATAPRLLLALLLCVGLTSCGANVTEIDDESGPEVLDVSALAGTWRSTDVTVYNEHYHADEVWEDNLLGDAELKLSFSHPGSLSPSLAKVVFKGTLHLMDADTTLHVDGFTGHIVMNDDGKTAQLGYGRLFVTDGWVRRDGVVTDLERYFSMYFDCTIIPEADRMECTHYRRPFTLLRPE